MRSPIECCAQRRCAGPLVSPSSRCCLTLAAWATDARRPELLDWLTAPATDADRIRLARLLASGRADAVSAALHRLAEHHAAGEVLNSWQRAAMDLLAVSRRPALRQACLAEAARLRARAREHRPEPASMRPTASTRGVRRYGPPPRLQGCKGKTVRWRLVPTHA